MLCRDYQAKSAPADRAEKVRLAQNALGEIQQQETDYKKEGKTKMEFKTLRIGNVTISKLLTDGQIINTVEDALDLMANANSNRIVISKNNLNPDFFVLKSRLAGEILQKFSNYGVYLAIVGDYTNIENKNLLDFIYESNKAGRILFLESEKRIEEIWK